MKIICINGQGGVGKDSFVNFCGSERQGVFNYSMVDGVKEIARRVHWNGSKELKDRKFLSDLKDLVDEYNDFSFKDVEQKINSTINYFKWHKDSFMNSNKELIFFVHAREPKDIQRWKDEHGARAVIVRRNEIEGNYGNHADDQVFDFDYDYTIYNQSTLDELFGLAKNFINNIREEDWTSWV